MLKMFWNIIKVFVDFLKIPFFVLLFCFVIFCCFCTFFLIKKLLSGAKMPKSNSVTLHKSNLFVKLFWEVPRQFVEDIFCREPDFFGTQGLVVFEGRQGNGKTIGMTHYIQELQYKYPKCKVITNYCYSKQDKELKGWEQLIDYKNAKKGVVVGLDELQNWFSSNDSRNFPPEMLRCYYSKQKKQACNSWYITKFLFISKGNTKSDNRGASMCDVSRLSDSSAKV